MDRYAVLFKAHFWDGSVAARFQQIAAAAPSGDMILFLDETRGPVATDIGTATVRSSVTAASRLGLAATPAHAVFWYNTDYPLYLSAEVLAPYDYVLMVEHDCGVFVDIDAMVQRARQEGVDFAAASIHQREGSWHWLPTLNGVYPPGSERPCLTCTCLLSRPAWRHLFAQRLRQAVDYARGVPQSRRQPLAAPLMAGVLESWPFSEAFMGTELAVAGFKLAELSHYGSTAHYDWWPPAWPVPTVANGAQGFYHPILTGKSYVASLLRHSRLEDWFDPGSELRARLREQDQDHVVTALAAQFMQRFDFASLRRLERVLGADEWRRLGLGYDVLAQGRPSFCSAVGEQPQWWAVDLQAPVVIERLTLAPHDRPMTSAPVRIEVSLDQERWDGAGLLPPGAGVAPAEVTLQPPRALRYIRLWSDTAETLRTGPLRALAAAEG